jgi:hypothetical protein
VLRPCRINDLASSATDGMSSIRDSPRRVAFRRFQRAAIVIDEWRRALFRAARLCANPSLMLRGCIHRAAATATPRNLRHQPVSRRHRGLTRLWTEPGRWHLRAQRCEPLRCVMYPGNWSAPLARNRLGGGGFGSGPPEQEEARRLRRRRSAFGAKCPFELPFRPSTLPTSVDRTRARRPAAPGFHHSLRSR